MIRTIPKTAIEFDAASSSPITPMRTAGTGGPVVSFADFLVETDGDDISCNGDKKLNHESSSTPIQKIQLNSNVDS
jgi:hypothetical protein